MDPRDAELLLVGPLPPLRGGIAAHGLRLAEALRGEGRGVAGLSYRRLYPSIFFPGRTQRTDQALPPWAEEVVDVADPRSWLELGRRLRASEAPVLLEWWHPVVAPALLVATRGLAPGRLVAVCHNLLPHEPVPFAAAAARRLLGRCGRILCHGSSVAASLAGLLGPGAKGDIVRVPLPGLLAPAAFEAKRRPPELEGLAPGTRLVVAAGHLRSYKGTALLARAWRRAKRSPEARLLLAGESYLAGRSRRELDESVGNDPSIVLLNRYLADEELAWILASAELLLAAHLEASQSGLLPIARLLGLPCLVSDAGSLAEQAGEGAGDEDGSRTLRAGDETALAAAIEERLTGPPPSRRSTADDAMPQAFAAGWQRVIEAIGLPPRP